MEELIQYFSSISDNARGIILVSGLTLFLILELWVPLFKFDYKKSKHAFLNIFFNITTMAINLSGAIIINNVTNFNSANNSGILKIPYEGLPILITKLNPVPSNILDGI